MIGPKPGHVERCWSRFLSGGFTLIELLVVVAIIAITAAIFFPVFNSIKKAAYKITAVSNGRQLGEANEMYSTDYDDVYCPYFSGFDPAGSTYNSPQEYWPQLVSTYVQAVHGRGYLGQALADDLPKVFFDPIKPFKSQLNDPFNYGIISSWGVSDDIANWFAPTGQNPSKLPVIESEVEDPTDCIHLVETFDWLLDEGYPGDAISLSYFDSDQQGASISVDAPYDASYLKDAPSQPADSKGRNIVVFCDGHVKAVVLGDLLRSGRYWSITGDGTWP